MAAIDPRLFILDSNGYPVLVTDLAAWSAWFAKFSNRSLARTELPGDVIVSTVFTGTPVRESHLFETLTMHGDTMGDSQLYTSKAEALNGHKIAVAKARGLAGKGA